VRDSNNLANGSKEELISCYYFPLRVVDDDDDDDGFLIGTRHYCILYELELVSLPLSTLVVVVLLLIYLL